MPVWELDDELWFPPVEIAEEDGLLAFGGDLNVRRLLLAYKRGIFPWTCDEGPHLWWSPDPRFVLFPERLKVSKSMQKVLKKGIFEYRYDTAFDLVIRNCATSTRKGNPGTWISEEIVESYTKLFHLGIVHCAESWKEGELVGGLYGLRLGNAFFGESMFSKESNASKAAFINLVRQLQSEGVKLIDCQMHTEHLESLGGEYISRKEFMEALGKLIA